ncbi:hypothetical protein MMC29_001359 [Sticta canariensis]|nr:hypothetical protein [Sticta canariensis]
MLLERLSRSQQITDPPVTQGRNACRVAGPARKRRRVSRPVSPHATALEVTLLDYGAGNVRSVRNALKSLGYSIKELFLQVTTPQDIAAARRLVFPGVGAFEQCMGTLERRSFVQPLKQYIQVGHCVAS